MNKALIPAFFLLGSLIVGVSVMVPQFADAQGAQKVNEQQLQALKLFFNVQKYRKYKWHTRGRNIRRSIFPSSKSTSSATTTAIIQSLIVITNNM